MSKVLLVPYKSALKCNQKKQGMGMMSEVRVRSKVQKNIQQEEGKHSKMSSQNKKVTRKELILKLEGGG